MKFTQKLALILFLSFFSVSAQNTIWDYIGVWQYSNGKESLNISKLGILDDLTIQFNSYTDGFENREFQNCKFIDGKIIGDHYGGKNNVIIVKKDNILYLTIKPFHEFKSIIGQPFTLAQKKVLKYVNISNTNKLVPGERILVEAQNTKKLFDVISSTNEKIASKKLNSIKPLFTPKDVKQKGVQKLNPSERFIIKTYKSLNKNATDLINKDNLLVINKLLYKKLQLFKIAPYPNKYTQKHHQAPTSLKTIIGTVDLDYNFYSLIIKFEYENEYNTYLVNYDLNGHLKGLLQIASGDYIESFTYTEPEFTPNCIFVNSYAMDSSNEQMIYKLHKSQRYIMTETGSFLKTNHKSINPDLERMIHRQKVLSSKLGELDIELYLQYHPSKEFAKELCSRIVKEGVVLHEFPFDLSKEPGQDHIYYHYNRNHPTGIGKVMLLPYKKNDVNHISEFWDRDYNTHHLNLTIKLEDVNNDGQEDLLMSIEDRSYVEPPTDYFCFINKDYQWVSSPVIRKTIK
ncbi:MAG: hypothetical protein ACPG45_04315 [Flavobacteriaceae bacterium]